MPRPRTAFRPHVDGLESRVVLSTTAVVEHASQQTHPVGSIKFTNIVYDHGILQILHGTGNVTPFGQVAGSRHAMLTPLHASLISLTVREPGWTGHLWLQVAPDAFAHSQHTGTYELIGFSNHSAVKVSGKYTVDMHVQRTGYRDPLRGSGTIYAGTFTFEA